MDNNLLEKRFIVTLVALIGSTFLLYTGKLDAANYSDTTVWVLGLFLTGGAVADAAKNYTISMASAQAARAPKD